MKSETNIIKLFSSDVLSYIRVYAAQNDFGVLVRVERGLLHAKCFAIFSIVLCTNHGPTAESKVAITAD